MLLQTHMKLCTLLNRFNVTLHMNDLQEKYGKSKHEWFVTSVDTISE